MVYVNVLFSYQVINTKWNNLMTNQLGVSVVLLLIDTGSQWIDATDSLALCTIGRSWEEHSIPFLRVESTDVLTVQCCCCVDVFRIRQNDVEQVRSAARIAARSSLASIVGCSTPRDFRRRMRSLSFRCRGRTAGASRSIYLAEPFKLSLRYSFCYRRWKTCVC